MRGHERASVVHLIQTVTTRPAEGATPGPGRWAGLLRVEPAGSGADPLHRPATVGNEYLAGYV
jgi:hypothetical protein